MKPLGCKRLNELQQHVSVHVCGVQGDHNAKSLKPNVTAKLLFVRSMACSSFVFGAGHILKRATIVYFKTHGYSVVINISYR
jgi:hypothetical protein